MMFSSPISIPGARTRAFGLPGWNALWTLRFSALSSAALIALLRWFHAGAGISLPSYSFAAALVAATCFAVKPAEAGQSPIEIDRTVRDLRSIGAAAGLAVAYGLAFPPMRGLTMHAFAGFAILTVILSHTVDGPRNIELRVSQTLARRPSRVYRFIKRLADIIGSVGLLAVSSPFIAVIAALIRLDSSGPVFFPQARIGEGGKVFCMLKFRSMYSDAPAYERSPTCSRDARITRVGRVLRRLGFDEIPQLVNVLRGEMSLVGPRPEMPFIVSLYSVEQRLRLNARPGITGLWQISPARSAAIHENLQYDLYYIEHRSLLLDLAIACRTLSAVIRGIGAV